MRERTKRRYKRYWRNFKEVKWYILLRFLSLMVMSAFFSTIATVLNFNRIVLTSHKALASMLSMMCIWFLLLDIMLMRRDYYRLTHRRKYRMVNYISHGAFAVINIFMAFCFSHSYVYAFTFSITKFARYTRLEISSAVSALIFHVVLIAVIRYAPARMKLRMHHG